MTGLTEPRFSGNRIIKEAMGDIFGEALKELTGLEYLDISENSMGDYEIASFAESLEGLTKLTYLNISRNSIGKEQGDLQQG